jgi:hypothetical protein
MELDLFFTILVSVAFESVLAIGWRDDAVWVLAETHAGHVLHMAIILATVPFVLGSLALLDPRDVP